MLSETSISDYKNENGNLHIYTGKNPMPIDAISSLTNPASFHMLCFNLKEKKKKEQLPLVSCTPWLRYLIESLLETLDDYATLFLIKAI